MTRIEVELTDDGPDVELTGSIAGQLDALVAVIREMADRQGRSPGDILRRLMSRDARTARARRSDD